MKKLLINFKADLVWLWLSLFIILTSLFYFIYQLNIYSLILALVLSYLPTKYLIKKKPDKAVIKQEKVKSSLIAKFLLNAFFVFIVIAAIILWLNRSQAALVSPWQVVPTYFFLFFSLAIFSLLLYFIQLKTGRFIDKIAIFVLYLLVFSLALIIYQIGYGFDPFIHEASIKHIIEHGFILPKNPYYIGQYSLIIALQQFFALPLAWLNKILVPVLAALAIPYFAYSFLKKNLKSETEKANIPLVIVLSLVLGFSPFIISTPQNLAYIFLLATIVFGLNKQVLPFGLVSALASFFIHPLAGLPALLFSLLLIGRQYFKKAIYKELWSYFIPLLSILVLPLSLMIGGGADFNFSADFVWPSFFWSNQENIILNFIYFLSHNARWLLVIMLIVAIISLRRGQYFHKIADSFKMALAVFIASALSFSLNWQNLISYEQADYAFRLSIIGFLFLLPLIWLFLSQIAVKIRQSDRPIKILILLYISFLISASLYLSYPRLDNYHHSRGWSLSKNDLKTVNVIADWAQSPYIVLANQQLGVAAMKEMGFDNYLDSQVGPLYFYSIPTGGALYQFFLQMVYQEANYPTMQAAMELAGVKEAYLVINQYWWASEKIIKEAKLSADQYKEINQGEIIIFRYLE